MDDDRDHILVGEGVVAPDGLTGEACAGSPDLGGFEAAREFFGKSSEKFPHVIPASQDDRLIHIRRPTRWLYVDPDELESFPD